VEPADRGCGRRSSDISRTRGKVAGGGRQLSTERRPRTRPVRGVGRGQSWERLDRHHAPGQQPGADGRKPGDQQAWSPEQRHALTRHVDERVRTAVDRLGANDDTSLERQRARYGALRAARDRALVYVLAYSAVRVGECLRDPLGRGSRRRQRAGRSPGVPGCLSRPGPQRSIIVIATVFIQTANRDGRASPRGTRGVYRSGTASVQ